MDNSVEDDPSVAPILRLNSVTKALGERQLLRSVSLRLRPREVLALCGASGCGKTTLLRIIAGLVPFDTGEIAIGDARARARAVYPAGLYGKVGLVFQGHNLFPHLTVIANVTLALRESKRSPPREAHDRGMHELERMGLASLALRYPSTLSGGEAQRVAIARALAMDPLLLLLDEPTANLDSDNADEVCERVVELAGGGTTMVLVTHNLKCARSAATSFAVLQDGSCEVSQDAALLDRLQSRWR
jgi:ABC-type polar amino acid transport system ATPase subunit